MAERTGMSRLGRMLFVAAFALGANATSIAQGRQAQAPPPGAPAKASALRDFTGYWVSVVTEEWRYRMAVPDKGDVLANVPLNKAGRDIAEAWDPAKDAATGNQCKSYGAAGIMYIPGRLHIYWQDGNTLRIDTDSGTETRLLHFGVTAPPPAPKTLDWQGYSIATLGRQRTDYAAHRRRRAFGTRRSGISRTSPQALEEIRPRKRKPTGRRNEISCMSQPLRCAPATCTKMVFPTVPTLLSKNLY